MDPKPRMVRPLVGRTQPKKEARVGTRKRGREREGGVGSRFCLSRLGTPRTACAWPWPWSAALLRVCLFGIGSRDKILWSLRYLSMGRRRIEGHHNTSTRIGLQQEEDGASRIETETGLLRCSCPCFFCLCPLPSERLE